MSQLAASHGTHVRLADEVRAWVELVAASALTEREADSAADSLRAAREALAATAVPARPRVDEGVPRWPVERSAVSGPLNPFAPPLVVSDVDGASLGTLTHGRALQGPPDHAHGGHIAMVFDHLAGRVAGRSGKPVVTGRLGVRYLAPTPVGVEVRYSARLRESRHSLVTVDCTAEVGALRTATAEVTFVELDPRHFRSALSLSAGPDPSEGSRGAG